MAPQFSCAPDMQMHPMEYSPEAVTRVPRYIPIYPTTSPAPRAALKKVALGPLRDTLQRPLQDLRISITDQCNFRCRYCMPKEHFGKNHVFLPQRALLDFDAIEALVQTAIGLGVRKVRLTGGEPLLRKGVESLIARLANLRTLEDRPLEVAMTTNGSLLQRKAASLKAAGLSRVTVSLDALDDAVFQRMNDAEVPVATVLAGIDAALNAGFEHLKVNVVVRKGWNDDQILPLARYFLGRPVVLRFIEFMDVGNRNAWSPSHVVSCADMVHTLQSAFDVVKLEATRRGETAQRWSYTGRDRHGTYGTGEFGVIGSVTAPFCGDCNRARVTADGKLFTCLFAHEGADITPYLRTGVQHSLEHLRSVLSQVWTERSDRYSELRTSVTRNVHATKAEMNYLGG